MNTTIDKGQLGFKFKKYIYNLRNPQEEKEYIIQKGDNLEKIARTLNVPISELISMNSITDPNKIRYGQPLKYKTNYYYDSYTPSPEIVTFIKNMEGFKNSVSKDANGNSYIGYGFQNPEHIAMGTMTQEDADKIFQDVYLPQMVDDLRRNTPNFEKLNQAQRDALLSYMYNTGANYYVTKHPSLQQALSEKRFDDVPIQMDWGYNDKNNPGIKRRRDAERQIFSGDSNGYTFQYKNGGVMNYLFYAN